MAMRNRHINTQEPPSCWNYEELSEQEQVNHTYWGCRGRTPWWVKVNKQTNWLMLFHSKEQCEAYCSIPSKRWKWDGKPATKHSLPEAIAAARRLGFRGVGVYNWDGKRLTTVKLFPASMPLEGRR